MTTSRRGHLLGISGYLIWGAFPLYFPLLQPGGPVEILAHRIVWSCLTMAALVLLLRRRSQFVAILKDRRTAGLLGLAAVAITINWGVFILGVNSGRVVETSLGYFINPLVTMVMGVLVFRERMRPAQWVAVGIGVLACVVLTVDYGRPPWIALILALSFGSYGLLKKGAAADAIESLGFETLVIAPFALGFLVWLQGTGHSSLGTAGVGHVLLLASSGIVTAVPLLCFGAAATRIPLNVLGVMQYLTPSLHFAIGVLVVGEQMAPSRWAGFVLVWVALAVFTISAFHGRRRALQQRRRGDLPVNDVA
ncbi:MAG TPA: EamA family transporter RarD [Candidatus Avipropionibacterium avicola]|uniref:EamA family transporter RarD n=1 Tax=Candidatus Avipropionibacterium avicola TaxID=2840701 RepID=A0A9D1GYR0_9ACTN|nr:EamA family transporter RarD [Candidatus Avipropionibacterium avicola]